MVGAERTLTLLRVPASVRAALRESGSTIPSVTLQPATEPEKLVMDRTPVVALVPTVRLRAVRPLLSVSLSVTSAMITLDPDLGEDDVDLVDKVFDEADVVAGAGDDDGVAALVVGDGDEGAEFVGTGEAGDLGTGDVDDGWLRRGGLGCDGLSGSHDLAGADRLARRFLGGRGLAGDEVLQEGGDVFGGGVLEIDDFIAGVGVGLDVEFGDQLVEERILARVGDEDDLVGAVVGVVSGARAELVLERAAEDGAELVDEVGKPWRDSSG